MKKGIGCFILIFYLTQLPAQTNPIYKGLPVGKYSVGFKIVTIKDDSRIEGPEYNYLGEKNEGDRTKKITLHLWYPAKPNSGERKIKYSEYCYNHLRTTTSEVISEQQKNNQLNSRLTSAQEWFGNTTDDAWRNLINSEMLAQAGAAPVNERFPLLIGVLRPLSTSITNELLASNGYIVAMVKEQIIDRPPFSYTIEIPDLQFSIAHLEKSGIIDPTRIGTYGFSGDGFTQVLLAMSDYRIKALADIESGLYMNGLFQRLSSANYYDVSKLRVPFLHIFSRDLSKQEKFIKEFENKTKFSTRYRLLLNQPKLQHWDFATEGYTSCLALENRGSEKLKIQQSFEIASTYLLNFFNAELKSDKQSQSFIGSKPIWSEMPSSLWDIVVLPSIKPAPNSVELEYIIRSRGIEFAMETANKTIKSDSSTNIMDEWFLNNLGDVFLQEGKYKEAIGVLALNTQLHPDDPKLHDCLAGAYEAFGDQENMKGVSKKVLGLLAKKATLRDAEKLLKGRAERRLKVN